MKGGATQSSLLQSNTYSPREQASQIPIDAICAPSVLASQEEPPGLPYTNDIVHPPTSLPFLGIEESSQSFGLNYLDNVYLPPCYNQPAFYPDLNIESFISPVDVGDFHFDHPNTTEIPPTDFSRGVTHSLAPKPIIERSNLYVASFARVSQEDWQWLSVQVSNFADVLPADYELPSRHAISRYMFGFLTGFHPHFPVIHPPTLLFQKMAPELILALAAVGSNYCLELHQGVKIFSIAKSIAMERIRCREISIQSNSPLYNPTQASNQSPNAICNPSQSSFDGVNIDDGVFSHQIHHGDLETIQSLFFLMAMATWGGEQRSLVREAISTQSVLAMLVRQHGLSEPTEMPLTWHKWARAESARRTKLVIFCFFNLHTIAFNIPSPMLVTDFQLKIPCAEFEWEASNASRWKAANEKSSKAPLFQDCLTGLFSQTVSAPMYSSLGGHVLISALLQRIISIQQSIRLQGMESELFPELSKSLRRALQKWQSGWEQSPESSYSPLDNFGPIAFNSRVRRSIGLICTS